MNDQNPKNNNEAQSEIATSVATENQTSAKLKVSFADNQSPTGNDFANLIDASFNKMDGPIRYPVDEGIEVATKTNFTDLVSAANVSVDGNISVGDSYLTAEALKVGDTLDVGADLLTLSKSTHIEGKATLTGAANITKDATSEDAALTVEGGIKADTMHINAGVVIGESDAQLLIECAEGDDAIRVKKDDVTQFALDDKGQLSLGLSGEQSTAKLHIRHHKGDSDTLLRVDNRANDNTPIAITSDGNMGIGTGSPFNTLDVDGSVSIGQSALVSPENSLSVENRVGVGTASPMARLDIHTLSGETATIIRDGDSKLLDVSRNGVNTDVDLNVNGVSTLENTNVNQALHVTGESTLSNKATMLAGAEVSGLLNSTDHTQLNTLNTSGVATLDRVLVVKGDTKHGASVGIGLGVEDNHNPSASLHIRESDAQPSLKLETKLQERQLFVTNDKVTIGEYERTNIDFKVHGDTTLNGMVTAKGTLDVDANTSLNDGASVEKSLRVHQSGDVTDTTALDVTTQGNGSALHVKHDNEKDSHTLIIATSERVGIHTDQPEAPLHVASESIFDDRAQFNESVSISGTLCVADDAELDGNIRINIEPGDEPKAQVHLAHDAEKASLRVDGQTAAMPALLVKDGKLGLGVESPECRLDVKGDASISGALSVNQVFTATDTKVLVSQQSTDAAITVSKVDEEGQIVLHHDKIGVNVTEPQGALHVDGDTKLDGITTAQHVKVRESLTVTGTSNLTDSSVNGKVSINTPVESQTTDVHIRQSEQGHTAFRVDQSEKGLPSLVVKSGQIAINSDTPTAALDVHGDAKVTKTLDVQGRLTAHTMSEFVDHAHFSQSAAFSVADPMARIHISEDKQDTVAFQVDYVVGEDTTSLVARQGKLGIGTVSPNAPLDVKGDTELNGDLYVFGTTTLDNYLNVAQDAVFDSDLVVKEKAKLKDQTIIGRASDINAELTPNAQLYIADTNYKEALRIDSATSPSLIFTDGKLGLGNSTPRTTLDVDGEVKISGKTQLNNELYVEGNLVAYNNIDGHGKLDVSQKATFGSDVLIRGDLHIEDKTDIEEELTVLGATKLQNSLGVTGDTALAAALNVTGPSTLESTLSVQGDADIQGGVAVSGTLQTDSSLFIAGSISSGVTVAKAKQHIQVPADLDAMIFEKSGRNGVSQPLLTLDRNGSMALGKSSADAKLDVSGDALISGSLMAGSDVRATELMANGAISGNDLVINSSIQLANGPKITGFSDDERMGGDYSANVLVPTQAAVKAYIDNVVVPFGQGGKTYTISSQADFDDVFNRGENTIIDTNTTVLLLPLGNQNFNTEPYVLKNSVRVRSGVSIVGFNEDSTIIAKLNANCRFELKGNANTPVENVHFERFTFDGGNMEMGRNGGAIYLEYAQFCKFYCRLENHRTWGKGGAIYAVMSGSNYTASHIEATNIHHCQALAQSGGSDFDRSEGGAVYGVERSTIHAFYCKAEHGGAVAYVRGSQVLAEGCSASLKGGAAYRSPLLRMTAVDCSVDDYQGQGGGAYFCEDLMCEGQWLNNVAAEGPHIYASNHLTGSQRESYYWKGDYVGRRIDDGSAVWHNNNE
ncbi:hypothetical protein [Marinomonas balearica]|uniref:Uncharacterized protein n=1 Tax=Marinomonas balearica TaxID=491947 RepID=A0A4R6M5S0_9GAMM|nr:hypothetical protein [Marinomonas balearica]TDO96701.1 hypothetical protein DFP79_2464 [Marinomonas balearica]